MEKEVYIVSYRMLNEEDHGDLAIYSTYAAAEQARQYAESTGKYYRVWIDIDNVHDNFTPNDF
jgi:hypothetical protein